MFPGLGLGIGLFALGLVLVFLVWVLLRLLPHRPDSVPADLPTLVPPDPQQSIDAILVIQSGGRVEYINALARQWFELSEQEPADLERLARRVRPMNDFLNLCAVPGQKRLTVNARLLEATSYQVPGPYPLMLISLRSMDLTSALADGNEAAGSILKIVSDFNQDIAASLDLPATIQSVLENVNRVVPADMMELKVWEQNDQALVLYRFQDPLSSSGQMTRSAQSHFGALTDQLVSARQPLLLSREQIPVNGSAVKIQSYLGVPLMAGGELVGTLEAGQVGSGAFGQHDIDLLKLISGQAAVAIRNSILYQKEQRRASELAGLANLTQAVSAIQDPKELFARLVDSVVPLFDAEIVGFLLYDDTRRMLEGQVPFRGLPAQIVENYRAPIAANSPAERILLDLKPVLTLDASQDENWRALGLINVALAASLRDSALMPLVSAGRMVGYLQVSHHRGGNASFSSDELRLMEIAANQAAAIIENALLVQQTRLRTQRSDALRRIASLSASAATLDEALKYSMQELIHLFQADAGGIFLLDEARGQLTLHRGSLWGVPDETANSFPQPYIDDPEYLDTVTYTQKPYISGRLSVDQNLPLLYRPLPASMRMESLLAAPLMVREHSIGELVLGTQLADHFNQYDLQVVSSAASQLASMVNGANLIGQTDESLRRRVDQLTAIARVSRELSASLELDRLLDVVHNEVLRVSRADCGSILLFDSAAQTQGPNVTHAIGCQTHSDLTRLDRMVLESGKSLVVNDFHASGGQPPHDGVRSALVVPIKQQDRILGIIHLHANLPSFFDEGVQDVIETLASQVFIAIINVREYQDERHRSELLSRRADTLAKLASISYSFHQDQPLEQALHAIAQGIREATPFRVVLISVYEAETGLLRRVTGVGISPDTMSELMARKQPLTGFRQLMRPEFKISRSYFIPADQRPILPADFHYVYTNTAESTVSASRKNTWNADDFFLIPMEDAEGNPLGLISLDDPSNGLRPDRATIDSLEVFAVQASLLIGNSMRLTGLQTRIESLSDGIQRQQKLLNVSQNDLPLLLRKDLEQTISLHNLERRAQRVRAGLAITESVSRQLDASSALMALGRETLTQLGMAAALVAEESPEGPRLAHVLGSIPRATNVEALFGQRNPMRVVLQTGDPILVGNLDDDEEWRDTPMLTSLRAKGFICLPVIVEDRPIAAMLAVSPEPLPAFTAEDRQVYFQISRQTSVILQNISLLSETRRRLQEVDLLLEFSRRLSGLNPDDMVRSLLESARRVLRGAHAGVVFVWNRQANQLIPRAVSGYADNASLLHINYRSGEALPGAVFASRKTRRVDEVNFARDYTLSTDNLLLYRQATGGRLPVSSLLIPITAGSQDLGLLVLDNFNTVAAFRPEDEALLVSLAQQVALSLENVRLVQATQERAGQLQSLNEAAASLTSSLRTDELVNALLYRLEAILPYDTAALWLREKDRLVVSSAVGFPDTEKRLGLATTVTDSALFNEIARNGQAIVVSDVREDPRFPVVEAPRLSWMGIPLLSKGELAGVIALEKWQANFYTSDHVQVAMAFAGQATVSLENARLYEESLNRAAELDQRSQRLALLNRFSASLSGLLDANQILQITSEELAHALGVQRVSAAVLDNGRAQWVLSVPSAADELPQHLPDAPIFSRLQESHGIFTANDIRAEVDLKPLMKFLGSENPALLILPLIGGSELRALLFLQDERGRSGLNEIDLARTIVNQAAIALENARLYERTVRTAERFAILNETSAQINISFDAEKIYEAVHKAAQRVMVVEAFAITLLDEASAEIEGVYLIDQGKRMPNSRMPKAETISGRVIDSGQPLMTHTLVESEQAGGYLYGEDPLSILAVPMTIGGHAIGMLSAQSYQPNAYTSEDLQILGTLANQAAVAIQNARLFAETQRLTQELEQRVVERTSQLRREQQNTETLLRILTEVSSSLDLDRALNRTLSLLNEAAGAEQGTIMLLQADDNLLHYRAGYGYLSDRTDPSGTRGFTLKVGEGLAGWVVQNREAVLIDDLHQDPRWVRSTVSGQDHRSSIVAPLLVGEDVIGVLMIFHRDQHFFSPDILNLVKAIASQVAVAINNAHLYELIRDQAERLGVMLRKEQEDASRSQAILEAVADGVLVTGSDNHITFINLSTEEILGIKSARALGQSLEAFGGLFGRSAKSWMETVHRWSEEPSSFHGDTYAEQLELEDGRIALIHLAPVILQNDFLGTVSIFRDVTHEVEVDRLKSEFVATVSHELRTPMTSIKGYVDILLMGAAGAFNENQAHFLQIVKQNAERLNVLVNDLLDISRIEAGRITLTPQAINLRDVAEDVIADVLRRSQQDQKPMALSLDAPRDLPRVLGDTERVRQIISNLVDNAYHYTPENGTIKVHIQPLENNKEMQVDVEDNGVGIALEDQPRIFERFYRGEHPLVLATPGTGLGLAIVRQLIEMHGGRIWLNSRGIPGEGSTFSFTLPLQKKSSGNKESS